MHGEFKVPGGKLVVVDLETTDGVIHDFRLAGDFFLEPDTENFPFKYDKTLAHELGHLVMDAMTLVSPTETERRATSFAAEFLAPIDDIAFDLDRVSIRTVHELDELRLTWGISVSALVMRARERGVLSDYQYRSMFRLLNETGRMYGPRPGVAAEEPTLTRSVLEQLVVAGYTTTEVDEITLLTSAQRADLFRTVSDQPAARHLTMV